MRDESQVTLFLNEIKLFADPSSSSPSLEGSMG